MAKVPLALLISACVAAAAPRVEMTGDTATLVDPGEWYDAWDDIQYWITLGQSLAGAQVELWRFQIWFEIELIWLRNGLSCSLFCVLCWILEMEKRWKKTGTIWWWDRKLFIDVWWFLMGFVWFCIWRWPPLRCRMLWPAWPWCFWWHSRANFECLQEPQVSRLPVWHTGWNEGPRFNVEVWIRNTFLHGTPFGSRCNGGPRTTVLDVHFSQFIAAQKAHIWCSGLSLRLCYFDGEHDSKKLCIWVIQSNVWIGDFGTVFDFKWSYICYLSCYLHIGHNFLSYW